MRVKRLIILILILMFLVIPPVFSATNIKGYSDHILLFYPRNTTADTSYAIDLSEAVSLTTMGDDPLTFSEDSEKNLSIFRIYDTLANDCNDVPRYVSESANSYTTTNYFSNGESVTLKIHTSGLFVKVDDPGVTRDFSLSCILNEAHIASDGSSFQLYTNAKNITLPLGTKYPSACGASSMYSEFKDLGGGEYELFVPSTPTVQCGTDNYYPLLLRLFDFCIKLDEVKANERIEPGYYTTTITIESETTYRNIIWKGTKTNNHIDSDYVTMQMSQTITVYGYVPGEGISPPSVHLLTVSPSTDTYSMNLSDTGTLYDVARVTFHADDLILSTDSGIKPDSDSNREIRANYYKVYITPNSAYVPGGSGYGNYVFYRDKDPSETISYDLYLKTGTGGSTETALKNITSSTQFPTSTIIGHAEAISNNVFCLVPRYTLFTETFGGSQKAYSEFWDLTEIELYLKVTDSSNHSIGQYTTRIYFTLVTN